MATKKPGGSTRRPRLLLTSYSLERQLDRLEDGRSSFKWPHVGLSCGFPLLSEHLGGFQDALYVVAGASRMGKSTFALQLIFQALVDSPEAHALFLSLDQPARELNARLVAMAGNVPVEYALRPDPELSEKYEDARQQGLETLLGMKKRLTIIDESLGAIGLSDLNSFISQKRRRFDGPLLLALDPIFKLRTPKGGPEDYGQRVEQLCQELKTLCTSHEVGVLATTRLSRGAGLRRPTLADLEEQPAILYEARSILLFYCDFFNDGSTPFLEWQWGTEDVEVPIFEVNVAKNKMGSFSGRLYFRFFNSRSRFKECHQLEIDNYDKMLLNLESSDAEDPRPKETVGERFELIEK